MELAMCINRFMFVYFAADVLLCNKTKFSLYKSSGQYLSNWFVRASSMRPWAHSTFTDSPKFQTDSMYAMLAWGCNDHDDAQLQHLQIICIIGIYLINTKQCERERARTCSYTRTRHEIYINRAVIIEQNIEVCSQVTGNWRRCFNHITWPVCFCIGTSSSFDFVVIEHDEYISAVPLSNTHTQELLNSQCEIRRKSINLLFWIVTVTIRTWAIEAHKHTRNHIYTYIPRTNRMIMIDRHCAIQLVHSNRCHHRDHLHIVDLIACGCAYEKHLSPSPTPHQMLIQN